MELTMAEMLVWHNLTPFALQVSMTLVPNSKFDFLCFHPTMPILFSTKFSLAERWRQAAYEGDSLKRVYRNARCYLVTAAKEATVKKINDEIDNGEIFGIDKCLGVDSDNLKQLLEDISANHPGFQVPDKIDPIKSHKKSQYVYALKK